MQIVTLLLRELSARLDRRARRVLLFSSALALTFFARSTVAALQGGNYADAAAGLVMLGGAAVMAAVASTAPRRAG